MSSRRERSPSRRTRPAATVLRALLRALPEQDLHLERRGATWIAFCCNDRTARGRGSSIDAAVRRLAASLGIGLPRGAVLDPTTVRLLDLSVELLGPHVLHVDHVHGVWSIRWSRSPDRFQAAETLRDALLGAMRAWFAEFAMP